MSNLAHSASLVIRRRIDITDDDELLFWTREFGVSPHELFEAIMTVGSSARLVEAYLMDKPFNGSKKGPHPDSDARN